MMETGLLRPHNRIAMPLTVRSHWNENLSGCEDEALISQEDLVVGVVQYEKTGSLALTPLSSLMTGLCLQITCNTPGCLRGNLQRKGLDGRSDFCFFPPYQIKTCSHCLNVSKSLDQEIQKAINSKNILVPFHRFLQKSGNLLVFLLTLSPGFQIKPHFDTSLRNSSPEESGSLTFPYEYSLIGQGETAQWHVGEMGPQSASDIGTSSAVESNSNGQ